MTADPEDVVRVATGSLVAVELYREALAADGIAARVVGDDLSAGIGSALPDAVELWVHRADVAAAEAAIRRAEADRASAGGGGGAATS